MKIGVLCVLKNHFNTLYNANTNKISFVDIILFYVVPALFIYPSYKYNLVLSKDFYNLSITFFGIFIALLLNIEVAIFSIFTRKWKNKSDGNGEKFSERNKLISEVDSNISYLVLVCFFSLFFCLTAFGINSIDNTYNFWYMSCILIYFYIHFGLTLLMIIKRSHALFQREYREN